MNHTTLMNWEIFLDIAGICCCIFSIFYLIKLKRKSALSNRDSDGLPSERLKPLNTNSLEFSGNESFDKVLASINNQSSTTTHREQRKSSADPYDEVRRLLDLGVLSEQIAERTSIPQCEIDLIASLRRMQPDSPLEGKFGSK